MSITLETRVDTAPVRSIQKLPESDSCNDALTPRQREVLYLLAHGLSHNDIVMRLRISKKTVEKHLGDIHEQFQTSSIVQTVLKGITLNYLDIDELVQSYDLARVRLLSPAEQLVLETMVADGGMFDANKQIAQRCICVKKTVERHFCNIFEKLGVHQRLAAGLIYIAAKTRGLIPSSENL